MIKTILMPVLGDETDKPVYGTAAAAARVLGAHLEVLFVSIKPSELLGISESGDFATGPILPDVLGKMERAEEARTVEAHHFFKRFCERERIALHDVPPGPHAISAEWREEQGDPIAHVIGRTRYNDLLITRSGGEESGRVATLNEVALMQGGRPILVAPSRPPGSLNGTVAIAWKETPEAARAVSAAMPFPAGADRIVVLSINEGGRASVKSVDDIARQLRWHRFEVEARRLALVTGGVALTLVDAAHDLRAGLLVVGAYSHSHIREMILGGLKRHVLRGAVDLPVLLSR